MGETGTVQAHHSQVWQSFSQSPNGDLDKMEQCEPSYKQPPVTLDIIWKTGLDNGILNYQIQAADLVLHNLGVGPQVRASAEEFLMRLFSFETK
jgi:hypothetical protein